MHPIVCQIGPLTVYSYGVMLAVAVFICAFLLQKEAKRVGLNPHVIFDLVFWIVISGIIGSRLFFILLNLSYFLKNPSEVMMLQHGGLAWQGGLIFGTATALFLFKKRGLSVREALDFFAPYVALGQAIGRIGCFLNGCCYGREASWGIYFPVHHLRLHPTQLYDSFGLLILFIILKKYQNFKRYKGEVFVLYLLWASIQRFIVEFFRADHVTVYRGLSIFQILSLCFIAIAIYAHLFFRSQSRK